MQKKFPKSDEIDELIGKKIVQKIEEEIELAEKVPEYAIITDFELVPAELTFSTSAIYMVFNRSTKMKTFINGTQAESIIGLASNVKINLTSKTSDNFTVNEYFVRFHQIKLPINVEV